MTHQITTVTTAIFRRASFCKTIFPWLVICLVINILCEPVFSNDSAGNLLTPENINKHPNYTFVLEVNTGDLRSIKSNRFIKVRVEIGSKVPGFNTGDVNAMLLLGRLGAVREGEIELGYFALKPELIDKKVVFTIFVIPESLERLKFVLSCGENYDAIPEVNVFHLFLGDFLSKEQLLAIQKIKDARKETAAKEAAQENK